MHARASQTPQEAYQWFKDEMDAIAADAAELEVELTRKAEREREQELRGALADL